MAWNPIADPVDHILLGDKRSPGYADVDGASSIRRWDEREGFGITGSFSVFKGRGLAHFMAQRIRKAIEADPIAAAMKGIIESDAVYIGGRRKHMGRG